MKGTLNVLDWLRRLWDPTIEKAAVNVAGQFRARMERLKKESDNALSSFRKTATTLGKISEDLTDHKKVTTARIEELNQVCADTDLLISDNDKVRAKILDFLGSSVEKGKATGSDAKKS